MKPGGQKRRRWRIVRRLVFVFIFGLLAIWGTTNLFFSISWGTRLVASRIEKRVGFPCSLESVTWTPWGGVVVRDFVVTPKTGSGFGGEILRVDTVKLDPSWFSLMQRKKRFERLEISGVNGEVSIELLRSLLKSDPLPQASAPPEKEAVPDESPVADEKTQGTKKQPAPAESPGSQKEAPRNQIRPVDDFEGVVVLRDVNLALTSQRFPGLSIAVESMEGELPVWGRDRKGAIGFSALHLGGEMVGGEEVHVHWKNQMLRVEHHQMKVAGLDLNMNLALRLVRGLPLGIQIEAPNQQVDFSSLFGESPSPISIGQFSFSAGLQGYLTMPQSFAGLAKAGFRDLKIRDGKDGSTIEFYRGFGEVRINRAGIIVPDARMIGDEDAVLLNGFVTSNGEAAVTVRVVGSPERAEAYEKRVLRANDRWTLKFKPLVTEDRLYRDLRLESAEDGLTADLGEGGDPVPLFPAMKAILTGQPLPSNLLQ